MTPSQAAEIEAKKTFELFILWSKRVTLVAIFFFEVAKAGEDTLVTNTTINDNTGNQQTLNANNLTLINNATIEDNSKHLFFIHIGFLDAIQHITCIEETIYKCYDKGITVVIDATWEQVTDNNRIEGNSGSTPSLEAFKKIEYLIHKDYFKVLVGQELRYIDLPSQYKQYLVYYNMFAGMIYAYHKPIKRNILYPYTKKSYPKKRYNFSFDSVFFFVPEFNI